MKFHLFLLLATFLVCALPAQAACGLYNRRIHICCRGRLSLRGSNNACAAVVDSASVVLIMHAVELQRTALVQDSAAVGVLASVGPIMPVVEP